MTDDRLLPPLFNGGVSCSRASILVANSALARLLTAKDVGEGAQHTVRLLLPNTLEVPVDGDA